MPDEPTQNPESLIAQLKEQIEKLQQENAVLRRESEPPPNSTELSIFKRFTETSTQGLGMGDLTGTIVYANPTLARILGFEHPEDVKGTQIRDYYLDGDRERLEQEIIPEVIATGMKTVDMPLVSIHGKATQATQGIFLLRDDAGQPQFLANVITDMTEHQRVQEQLQQARNELESRVTERTKELQDEISERRQIEKALREREEDLRITLESIGDAVIATDSEGLVTRMNGVAEQMTGWNRSEAIGKPLGDVFVIVNADSRDPVENPVSKVVRTGEIVGLANHTLLISRNSSEYQIADSGAPIRDAEGSTVGVVLVFRDITEQYAVAEQLRHSQKMDSIGRIAGGVAHDFNNILTGIIGSAEVLFPRLEDDETCRKYLQIIIDTSERAAELTGKLLAFSRKGKIVLQPIDLHEAIRDVITILESTIDRRISLTTEFSAEQSTIVGDPSQIENALLNLGINARDAMPDGGVLNILTEDSVLDEAYCNASPFDLAPGRYIVVSIRDTGIGMTRDILDKIFEPFFTTKAPGEGTGLGLAAIYGTVKDHHGAITTYSEPGKGTVFHIYFPVDMTVSMTYRKQDAELTKRTGCVLIVDDEEVIRFTGSQLLSDLGYDVLLAEDGEEGLAIYRENSDRINLVILDMVMPKMNGRDCFREIRKLNPDAQILMSSGFARGMEIEALYKEGLTGFLKKPYRQSEIATILTELI